jgi:acetyl-CoA carboxylase carboxyl transferase subunit alpha
MKNYLYLSGSINMDLKKIDKQIKEIKEKIEKLKRRWKELFQKLEIMSVSSEHENEVRELKETLNNVEKELREKQKELRIKSKEFFKDLSPWDRVQLARHPERPKTSDYIKKLFRKFYELKGDRFCGEDPAIVGGIGFFYNIPVAVIGHEKGKDTKERMRRNFGMPNPEGYRKAIRIMKLAEKFSLPLITFVDTPGAFPGLEAEMHNQSYAIAESIYTMAYLKTPTVSFIIGEGGSGGALAIAVADRVYMLENSVYSVISPEGCAAILWKDQKEVQKAAEALKLTAEDLKSLGVIDGIIPEPLGSAHINPDATIKIVKFCLKKTLKELLNTDIEELLKKRIKKYVKIGVID